MTKKELVAAVSEKTGLTKKDSEAALSAVLDAISESLSKGNDVQLTGFGTFSVKARAEHTGKNPKTGKAQCNYEENEWRYIVHEQKDIDWHWGQRSMNNGEVKK